MEHIYVLECDGNNYFVGKTNDICKTFNEHVSKRCHLTKSYNSLKMVEIVPVYSMFDEQSKTLEYMVTHGHHKVRGGPYNTAVLTKEQINSIKDSITSATSHTKTTTNNYKTYAVKWTEEEETLLRKEMVEDKNYKKIALSHKRTEIAIQSRVRLLVNREMSSGKSMEEACECLNITTKEYNYFNRFATIKYKNINKT